MTSKPRISCIQTICDTFKEYKDLIQFRFTITSHDDKILRFWEPGAPYFKERWDSLKYAYHQGFRTSVSIEPYLDKDPFILVEKLKPFASESIWIGKMNYIKATNIPPSHQPHYKRIRDITSNENLKILVKRASAYNNTYLRLKDSIFNALS